MGGSVVASVKQHLLRHGYRLSLGATHQKKGNRDEKQSFHSYPSGVLVLVLFRLVRFYVQHLYPGVLCQQVADMPRARETRNTALRLRIDEDHVGHDHFGVIERGPGRAM